MDNYQINKASKISLFSIIIIATVIIVVFSFTSTISSVKAVSENNVSKMLLNRTDINKSRTNDSIETKGSFTKIYGVDEKKIDDS